MKNKTTKKLFQSITNSFILLLAIPVFSVAYADKEAAFHRFWPDNLFAVDFLDEQVGFIAGYGGTFLRTSDGGNSWQALYVGKNELIRRISFVDSSKGWAVGHRGSILYTEDAGTNWVAQLNVPGEYIRDIEFVDQNTGWAVGHNALIYYTSDGGKNWQKQNLTGFTGRDVPRFHGIHIVDSERAILVGEFGMIAHTEDAGKTWLQTPVDTSVTWLAVDGDANVIYVTGLDGQMVSLSIATTEQRNDIDRNTKQKAEKLEAKARAKAKRMKREYIPKSTLDIPRSEIEYMLSPVETNTIEHLFDVSVYKSAALVVGRSYVAKVTALDAVMLKPEENFPLNFIWLGGATITQNGKLWAVGIRGLVVEGDFNNMSYKQSFNLAASNKIELINNRWGGK
jgi:hypothetical protein